jgi:hypothetical protein
MNQCIQHGKPHFETCNMDHDYVPAITVNRIHKGQYALLFNMPDGDGRMPFVVLMPDGEETDPYGFYNLRDAVACFGEHSGIDISGEPALAAFKAYAQCQMFGC